MKKSINGEEVNDHTLKKKYSGENKNFVDPTKIFV